MARYSIVTPSYNQGEFLEETIRSIIDQQAGSYNLQYIIQDNCSDDITSEILARYDELENFHVRVEADAGQADALRRGFECSDGDILGWVNSDDVLLPNALETVAQVFEDNSDIDAIYGDAYFMDAKGVLKSKYPTSKFNPNLLKSTCFLSQPSVFFRKTLYEKVGGISKDLHYCLDYNLWLKFYVVGAKFYYLRKPLSVTRIYDHTKTATGGKAFVDEILQMLQNELGYIPNCWKLYAEYSKEKGFLSNYKLLRFIEVSCRFLFCNPGSIAEILPYVIYLTKNQMGNCLTGFLAPFNRHYSDIKHRN